MLVWHIFLYRNIHDDTGKHDKFYQKRQNPKHLMSYKIRAAILNNPESDFKIDDVILAELADNEVLVEIKACGICHMDIEAKSFMPMPMVLGHEGAGIVVETGKNMSPLLSSGDHVILSYAACGSVLSATTISPITAPIAGK